MRRRSRPLAWLPLSLALTAAVIVPASILLVPRVYRWHQLRGLTSGDPQRREGSLNYVIRRARGDPAVRAGAVARLGAADDENFRQLLNALDHAGRWRRPDVPDAAWLRWISMLATDRDPEARIAAAQRLAEMRDAVDTPAAEDIARLLGRLAGDDQADVRYNAVTAAAQLAGGGAERFVALLRRATADASPSVARRAWIFMGLLGVSPDVPPDFKSMPEAVAGAALWAEVRTFPADASRVIAVADDSEAAAPLRAAAVYALAFSKDAAARESLLRVLAAGPDAATLANQVSVGRAILGIDARRHDGPAGDAASLIAPFATATAGVHPPLARAALFRVPVAALGTAAATAPSESAARDLALIEGLLERGPVNRPHPIGLGDESPPLLRVLAAATGPSPSAADFRGAFVADDSALRDLACAVAAERLPRQEAEQLIPSLLRDYDDRAKMSGAILAGLSGLQGGLLAARAGNEDVWAVERVMRLALWMQGGLPEMDAFAPQLLAREEVPRTTVLLALLHRRHPAALEFLLNPRGEPTVDLTELLVRKRWWWVLRKHLPEDPHGATPPLWLWADPWLQTFQIEVLRDWYLIRGAGSRDVPDSGPGH